MSVRVDLRKGKCDKTVHDYCIDDFESLSVLAKKCAWQLPMRLYCDDLPLLIEFLSTLDRQESFSPSNIWDITYYDKDDNAVDILPEHPTWDDVIRLAEVNGIALTVESD